ncbi:MAG: epoxyqueuosine reductase, partial [Acidobacteria bacterium]|nr:epoxyqueuosine reductase [Acidobacteriota bacterium]
MDKTAKAANYQELKAFALQLGFDLFGVTDVTGLRGDILLEPATSGRFGLAVSLGKRLSDAVLDDIGDHPTQIYFHHYRQMNFFLDRGALLVADFIQKQGFGSLAIAASQIIDWEKQRAHLSHKHAGRAAGLGWFGRNNLLVNPELGARFRLVTVLTDMPLEPDAPLDRDCGPCRACSAACPAGAIKETREAFDHLACFEKLKEFRKKGYTT